MKLALLICDTPVPAVLSSRGTYLEIFKDLLTSSLASFSSQSDPSTTNPSTTNPEPQTAQQKVETETHWTLDGFDVVHKQEYPDLDYDSGDGDSDGEEGYTGILISGSAASAYEDIPWINKLVSFVLDTAQRKPHIKLIGICFGHQIIARAFGGTCVPNSGLWEVGVTDIDLTPVGKAVFQTDKPTISVQQMHRDHVPTPPPSFHTIGSTPTAPVQGLILPYASPYASQSPPFSAPALSLSLLTSPQHIHILTIQGHPEFSSQIVNAIIDVRSAIGVMAPDVAEEGRRRAVLRHDGDGVIGRAIWRVLGVGG
ncbi:class I glutamine amidotransferase-like protein [Rickenella mellea]|uniref:Class I glutamine amidotransferase-like protein n=1 Tax=Rickenella mellea TaxID=50990 RepID=A0A4Y7PZZ5_9AGAM|nr:class I glutamine amidotransferase-like protein [Rickenella mellea]